MHPAGLDGFAQLPGLLSAPLGEGAVGHAADLVFNIPDGLSVAGEIKLSLIHIFSLNGVRLNLNLDLGDMDLTGMLEQLQSGSVQPVSYTHL